MTAFIILCAAMLAAAALWTTLPLWRPKGLTDAAGSRTERRVSGAVVVLSLSALSVGLYLGLSNWSWDATEADTAQQASVDEMVQRLEAKLAANPKNLEGWLMLGRSYVAMGRYGLGVNAYQQAYDISQGQDVEALLGLGEALALTDEASLSGRAGELFEAALAQAPNHPKALWYGSMKALQAGDLRLGRDRLQLLLAQNPPAELRDVLQRQIQDLDQQLGEPGTVVAAPGEASGEGGASAAEARAQRVIRVAVSIAPQIQKQLAAPLPLFVLARDPGAGGPPLAVQRHSSASLPLTTELSERDAMMPTRTIASATKVQVVARLSRSGAPQAQKGDFYGEAEYEFGKDDGTLNIIIDRTVP